MNIQGCFAPLVGSNLKIGEFKGKKIVPVFKTLASMHKYMIFASGITTGAFGISDPKAFIAKVTNYGVGIVLIDWRDGQPIAEEIIDARQDPERSPDPTSPTDTTESEPLSGPIFET